MYMYMTRVLKIYILSVYNVYIIICITGWWFGTMEFYDSPIILRMSSSQLTKSIIFSEG